MSDKQTKPAGGAVADNKDAHDKSNPKDKKDSLIPKEEELVSIIFIFSSIIVIINTWFCLE